MVDTSAHAVVSEAVQDGCVACNQSSNRVFNLSLSAKLVQCTSNVLISTSAIMQALSTDLGHNLMQQAEQNTPADRNNPLELYYVFTRQQSCQGGNVIAA